MSWSRFEGDTYFLKKLPPAAPTSTSALLTSTDECDIKRVKNVFFTGTVQVQKVLWHQQPPTFASVQPDVNNPAKQRKDTQRCRQDQIVENQSQDQVIHVQERRLNLSPEMNCGIRKLNT